ncbi:1-phosphatidylinositol 45-bisphosphate phosphodiesterase 1 [Spathaspora sp. JA1]|nr:1-phosphatidylinositol 45-bisphosphate phosphodiesterase 1 [Spathaspora sp. JA1]
MSQTVYIIDVESGNLQSLSNAIKRIGNYTIKFIHNGAEFKQYDNQIEKLLFPGVGNYGHFVKEIHARELTDPINAYIKSGRSLMGICVGLQAFFKDSEESPEFPGLGYLDLSLLKFNIEDPIFKAKGLKKSVPHIGWNHISEISVAGDAIAQDTSLYGINLINKYYFVHSYGAILTPELKSGLITKYGEQGWDFAFAKYGSEEFLAAINYKNFFATQFHPEKSGVAGLKVIKNFLEGNKFPIIHSNDVEIASSEDTLSGLSRRIIACLDVRSNDDGDLVVTKGDQYNVREQTNEGESKVRNLGKPVELATRYYNQGADEVTFLNITSFRNSPIKDLPMLKVLSKAAETIFVPLTVGGGIKDMIDPETGEKVPAVKVADLYFRSGADKVSIGSDAVIIAENYYQNNKQKTGTTSIETISATFGNQAVVISVDPKRKYIATPDQTTMSTIKIEDPEKYGPNGEQYCYYQVTSQGGRKIHELGALELCVACEDLGAGEILLNSIDHDGSNQGYNLELLQQIKRNVSIPVIASSGAGVPKHFQQVFELDCGIDAALGAGLFHRGEYTVNDVKRYLQKEANMDVRLDDTMNDTVDIFKSPRHSLIQDSDIEEGLISPSDLHYSPPRFESRSITKIKSSPQLSPTPSRTPSPSSTPIQSSLPSIFSHLRSKDTSKVQDTATSGKKLIKKLLHLNKSTDDVSSLDSASTKSVTSSLTRKLQRAPFILHPSIAIDSLQEEIELDPELSKSIGHIKIPPSFIKEGLPLLKISHKSKKRILFYIDSANFKLNWRVVSNSASPSPGHRLSISGSSSRIYEFTLDDIKSIYMGLEAGSYREEFHVSKEFEQKWITIIYFNQKKNNLKTLHLIADTNHDFKKLSLVLQSLRNLRDQLAKQFLIDFDDLNITQKRLILDKALVVPDEQGEIKQVREFLSFNDILKYTKRLNISVNRKHLESIFNEVSKQETNSCNFEQGLNFEQFKMFVSKLKKRDDIIEIWNSVCQSEVMDFECFVKFITTTQHETYPEEMLIKIYNLFSVDDYWIPESLNNFLLSKFSKPIHHIQTPDYFNHPLTDYFISSSHNTYLIGRQVVGDSSVEGYIRALQRGCRSIEIDVWDGPNTESNDSISSLESEPIVNHGRTFTTPIRFDNVIRTIKKFAFITTPLPLILSLEINCSASNQLKVVNILKEILGDSMIQTPIDNTNTIPSPAKLKHKFLIKSKKTSAFHNLVAMEDGSYTTSTTSISEDGSTKSNSFIRRKPTFTKIIDELSELGVYIQGIKYKNFSLPESKTFNHCFSLNEKSINVMIKDNDKKIALDKHNGKYFMRVYPAKMRLKSSNFIPLNYWEHGVQMVATNWQTYDLGQQLNEALFEGVVDHKGYVLKPAALRAPQLRSTKRLRLFKQPNPKTIKFAIDIISAHQLPKPKDDIINPFITFEIIGANTIQWDSSEMENGRTRVIFENGFNPIWKHKFTGVLTCSEYDFVFLKFTINSSGTEDSEPSSPIGISVVRMCYLKQGYRYLPINDVFGEQLVYSSLFIKIVYSSV